MAHSSLKRWRHHKGGPQEAAVSLTSMMDAFTILLAFLLTSFSSEGEIITVPKNLQLPVSSSLQKPRVTLNLIVSTDAIVVEGRPVETIDNIIKSDTLLIPALESELLMHAQRSKNIAEINKAFEFKGDITIQADRTIPFRLLKKIMYTCGQTEFSNISLAVISNE